MKGGKNPSCILTDSCVLNNAQYFFYDYLTLINLVTMIKMPKFIQKDKLLMQITHL